MKRSYLVQTLAWVTWLVYASALLAADSKPAVSPEPAAKPPKKGERG